MTQPVDDALASFRAQWQRELGSSPNSQNTTQVTSSMKYEDSSGESSIEKKAKDLFMKGTENEQNGKLYEAIQFYRRAVQLVPDIEFRLYETTKLRPIADTNNEEQEEGSAEEDAIDTDEENEFNCEQDDLLTHLQRIVNRSCCVCLPNVDQMATHISALPMEIILYILRWVVSSDLDLRSLEMCSRVCRGLYVCSRDAEIWRLACVRVWGVNCGGLTGYNSWREMYLLRPRLHFNGCYISKTTYVRHGENSFQDQFYRPWHLVEYYRYLRFFPEGIVLMMTTPEEPLSCLGLLKTRHARHPAVMKGHYRLHDDHVTLVLQKQDQTVNSKYRSRRQNNTNEHTFHLELQILSYRSRINMELVWRGYSVFTKNRSGIETSTSFELSTTRFPPFWFSRVKSYTAEADSPLM